MARVGLHLRPVFLLQAHGAGGERLLDVKVVAAHHRPAHVAVLGNVLGRATATRAAGLLHRGGEDQRGARPAGVVDLRDVRQHLVFDVDGARRVVRLRLGERRHRASGAPS